MAVFKIKNSTTTDANALSNTSTYPVVEGTLYFTKDHYIAHDYASGKRAIINAAQADNAHAVDGQHGYQIQDCYTTTGTVDGRYSVEINKDHITSLYDGLTIRVCLNRAYDGTFNTLNLNSLGEKIIWYRYNSRMTSHFSTNSILTLTYKTAAGSYAVSSSATNTTLAGTTATSGWIVNYAYNDGNNYYDLCEYYTKYIMSNALYRYQLVLTKDNNTIAVNTTSNSTSMSKGNFTTLEFNPFGQIFRYYSTTTVSAGNKPGDATLYSENLTDMRYSFNNFSSTAANSGFASGDSVYLVATLQTNNNAKLYYGADGTTYTACLSKTLPTSDDGLIYIYLGQMYDSYRLQLKPVHPVYRYKDGKVGTMVHNANFALKATEATHATNADIAKWVQSEDVRSTNETPTFYFTNYKKGMVPEFKSRTNIGSPGVGGTYVQLVTHNPWTDASGGYPVQVAYGSTDIAFRSGKDANTWNDWKILLNSSNYTDYAVKKDGSNATGPWGISITGNAATATSATSATSAGKLSAADKGSATNPIYFSNGVPAACTYELKATVNNGTQWGLPYYSTTTNLASIGAGTAGQYLIAGGTAAPSWTSSLIGSAAMTLTSGKFPNLTANRSYLYANGLAITNPGTPNDQGWVRVIGSGETDTVLEIATGDDGNNTTATQREQIAVRQYGSTNVPIREIKLFDQAGDTIHYNRFRINNNTTTAGNIDFNLDATQNNVIYNYARLWINSFGTAGDGTNNGTAGTTILSLGNNIARTTTNGSGLGNAAGYLRLYDNNSTYLEIQPSGMWRNKDFTVLSGTSTTANTAAYSYIIAGNATNISSTSGHSEGRLRLYSAATAYHQLAGTSTTTNYTHYLPNSTGWVVTAGNGTSTGAGSSSQPIYISTAGVATAITGALGNDITGNAATATKATQDSDGNAINTTYLKLGGGTMTGTLTLKADPTAALQAATKQYVDNAFAVNDAMVYKGTLSGASTTTYTPAAKAGDTYKVAAAGLINGERVEIGDLMICTADDTAAATSSNVSTIKTKWNIINTNVDGALFKSTNTFVDTEILVADGTTGKVKSSGKKIADFALQSTINGLDYTDTASGYVSKVDETDGKIAVTHASFTKPSLAWTAGTTVGPTLKVTTDGGTSDAQTIPSASNTASGVVNTTTQTFAGAKTFTGVVYVNNTTDAAGNSDNGGLIIGNKTAENIAIDGNEIMARNNKAASTLYINNDGGLVSIGSGGLSTSGKIATTSTADSAKSTDTTAALSITGGISVQKQMSAKQIKIDNGNATKGVQLIYDDTLECVNFVFS